ncbi:hypothetical protein ACFW2Y_10320 [Streptomyces sp. NPDC058877]|uniref:hypothetical protein n=1 Tax=unclassified Streptomyces TaxID=2593676 RepID=UPI0036C6368C
MYEDTTTALAALDTAPHEPREQRERGRAAALRDLVMRMARLLGLITPSEERVGPWTRIGQWALVTAVFLIGLVAPLVWLPYMAVSYDRATNQLIDRATLFYVGTRDLRSPRSVRVDPAMTLAALRALGSLLLPAIALLVIVLTDTRIAGGRWPVAGIVLTTSCLCTGGWWLWRRRARTPHGEAPP